MRRSFVMRTMWCTVLAVGCALVAGTPQTLAGAAEPDFAVLERQFVEMPMEARRLTGPLFWLKKHDLTMWIFDERWWPTESPEQGI